MHTFRHFDLSSFLPGRLLYEVGDSGEVGRLDAEIARLKAEKEQEMTDAPDKGDKDAARILDNIDALEAVGEDGVKNNFDLSDTFDQNKIKPDDFSEMRATLDNCEDSLYLIYKNRPGFSTADEFDQAAILIDQVNQATSNYISKGQEWLESHSRAGKRKMWDDVQLFIQEAEYVYKKGRLTKEKLLTFRENSSAKSVEDEGMIPEEIELSGTEKDNLQAIDTWEPTTFQEDLDFLKRCYFYGINERPPKQLMLAISSLGENFEKHYFKENRITQNLPEAERNYITIQLAEMKARVTRLDLNLLIQEVERNPDADHSDLAFKIFKNCRETSEIISSLPPGMRGEYGIVENIVDSIRVLTREFEDYDINKPNVRDVIDNLKDRGHGEVNGIPLGKEGYEDFPEQPKIPEGMERIENMKWTNFEFDLSALMEGYETVDRKPENRDQLALLFQRLSEFESRYPLEIESLPPKIRIDFYQKLSYINSLIIPNYYNEDDKIYFSEETKGAMETVLSNMEKTVKTIQEAGGSWNDQVLAELYWAENNFHSPLNGVFFGDTKAEKRERYATSADMKIAEGFLERLHKIHEALEPYKQQDNGSAVVYVK